MKFKFTYAIQSMGILSQWVLQDFDSAKEQGVAITLLREYLGGEEGTFDVVAYENSAAGSDMQAVFNIKFSEGEHSTLGTGNRSRCITECVLRFGSFLSINDLLDEMLNTIDAENLQEETSEADGSSELEHAIRAKLHSSFND